MAHELGALTDRRSAVEAAIVAARAAWPELVVPERAFRRHLEERLPPDDAEQALASLHVSDLYLACACLLGHAPALAEFDRRLLPEIRGALATMDISSSAIEEVQQLLRHKLFVCDGVHKARIADYAGRGPLGAWVRVAAVRTALNLRRQERRNVELDSQAHAAQFADQDPELAYIKTRYRAEFKVCIDAAFASLDPRERNLLRLYLLDGLTLEALGKLHQVNASTVWRWIEKAKESLLVETRRELTRRLSIDRAEFDSLMGILHSQLDVSLRMLMSQPPG